MPPPQDLRAAGNRIEQLVDELAATADPRTRDRAEELLRLVTELYGAALARILELGAAVAPDLISTLVADDLVASLLLVHGLHPESLAQRVEAALAKVRPLLASHGGDVEMLELDEDAGAVRLRLLGSCDGCPSSAITLQSAVEGAIHDAAPEVVCIDVDAPGPDAPGRAHFSRCKARLRALPDGDGIGVSDNPLAVLGRVRQFRPRPRPRPGEHCELCGEDIGDQHGHVVDAQARSLMCACRGCYLLFVSEGAGGGHFRAVPERYLAFPDFQMSPAQWEAMQVPVSVAFFFFNSALGQVAAFYPSPAGATESELPLDKWAEIVAQNPGLATLEPDVEAFLVRARPDRAAAECYLVPIDACYELVGHLRRLWRGFDGGREAHQKLEQFFERARARSGVDA